jgi:hypothetical protein
VSVVLDQRLPREAQRTPESWRDFLLPQLNLRAAEAAVYEGYYDGRHPLQFATSKFREAFGALFSAFADNWCQIVVDAAVERLRVVGFRVADGVSEQAWALWQENALDVESVIAHTEAGKNGRAFLLVDPNDGEPLITVEHASQVIVAEDPANRRNRLAALKRWLGSDGYVYLTVYLPDLVLKFESSDTVDSPRGRTGALEWVPRRGEPAEIANTLGVVPVIPLENKPGVLGVAHSDLEPAIPLQNAINKLCTDLIVTSEYGAFPQRVVTGVEVPKDPTTGAPLAEAEMKAAMSRLWTFKPPDAHVTALPAADLANFVNAIEMLVTHLAAQTRTPPHYLLAKLVNMSGDALSVAEAGLVSKCRTKTLFFSDSWEEAIALALTASGTETEAADCEAIWASPERVAQGQLVDAAVKKKTLGVPLPVIWLELGYTPEQIVEMEKIAESQREAELVAAAQAQAAAAREALTSTPASEAAAAPGEPTPTPAPAQPQASSQPPPQPPAAR